MNDVEFNEVQLAQNGNVGITIFRYTGMDNALAQSILDRAIQQYVGTSSAKQFVDYRTDNPFERIVVKGIDELIYRPYNNWDG